MGKALALAYGVVAYLLFLAVFLYAIGFVGGIWVPRSVDAPTGTPTLTALVIDALLLTLFAVQHSVMARVGFKRWWTRIIPVEIERSTYVLLSSAALAILFWQWRPIEGIAWHVSSPTGAAILRATFALGWTIVLVSTFLISHFDLFGLRQVWVAARGRRYEPPQFVATLLYRVVRHPLMLGFVIAFWATPVMTIGHLVFAIATTGYILVGVNLEERDLMRAHGEQYASYRRHVSMILPLSKPLPRAPAGPAPSGNATR